MITDVTKAIVLAIGLGMAVLGMGGCGGSSDDPCQKCSDNLTNCDNNPPTPLYTGCAQDFCDCMNASSCTFSPGSCGH